MTRYRAGCTALLCGALLLPWMAATANGASNEADDAIEREAEPPSAPVEIDGTVLFRVRGSSVYPAGQRAQDIRRRIEAIADDATVSGDAISTADIESGTGIFLGKQRILTVLNADADLESIDRHTLASAIVDSIRSAVAAYRHTRSRDALAHSGVLIGIATVALAVVVALIVWISGKLRAITERHMRQRIQAVKIQTFQVVRAEHLWRLTRGAYNATGLIAIVSAAVIYLEFIFSLLPWTRAIGLHLRDYIVTPLHAMAVALASAIPDLIILTILFLLTRYLLGLIRLFFRAVARGQVKLQDFDREWADPTYKLVRAGVIVFALVVAYPYVPGSGTDAFKGISIFIGILFSLGSSSAIANGIAGYLMTYRRAFRVGDRVQIGGTLGDVIETRVQVTHLRTAKNEEVIVPNSNILNNEVINYSSLARSDGLILHTTVGIGYEVPWRQVEAILLMAAERTEGLMKEPPPFVRQLALADFAVNYEINAYCDNAQAMFSLYDALHRNVLDVFNEYGIQIMTPAYRADPEVPKLVAKDGWFSAPAVLPTKMD